MTIYHTHHIVPRHAGGTDDPSNLIKLTVEEHAEAHRKLWEEYGNEYDHIAWRCLAGIITEEAARIEAVKVALTGVPKSEEQKQKMSDAAKERWQKEGQKEKLSKKMMGNDYGKYKAGWVPTEETRSRMSASAKKREKKYVNCDICGKKITYNNIGLHKKFSHK